MDKLRKFGKKFYKGWMKFAYVLGEMNFRIIFTILFIIVLGIYAIFYRLFSSIANLFKKKPETFWVNKKPIERTIESVQEQF